MDLPPGLAGELRNANVTGTDWLFPESRDLCYTEFRRTLKAAGLDGFTPHSLRHTFATIHLSNGADLDWLRRQIGHTNIGLTTALYGRAAKPKPRGAPEAFERAILGAGPSDQGILAFST